MMTEPKHLVGPNSVTFCCFLIAHLQKLKRFTVKQGIVQKRSCCNNSTGW